MKHMHNTLLYHSPWARPVDIIANEYADFTELPLVKGKGRSMTQLEEDFQQQRAKGIPTINNLASKCGSHLKNK